MTSPQPETELQKVEAIPAEILAWLKHIAQSIGILHAATPNAAPLPAPPTSTTTTTAGVAGTVSDVPSVETCNGVPVPDGMTLGAFTALVGAVSGVRSFLDPSADPSVQAGLVSASDAWFGSLGPYYVQQLVAQTTVATEVGQKVRAYTANHPVAESPTPAQCEAANLAAK